MDLKGKTLFITGASRGIGKAIALRAARDGANVAVVGKTEKPHPKLPGTVHDAVEEIERAGGRGLACIADIRFEDQVLAAVERTVQTFGGIDVLVNNAGVEVVGRPWKAETADEGDRLLQINLASPLRLTSHLLGPMVERRDGAVVFISSVAAWAPMPGGAWYSASKAGLARAAEAIRIDLKGRGVRVVAVYPGPVKTPMLDRIMTTSAKGFFRMLVTGTSTELARRIVDALRHDEDTVFYPSVYRATAWFMSMSRWVANTAAPGGRPR